MDSSQPETTALLDAVTQANNDLAKAGFADKYAIMVVPSHTTDVAVKDPTLPFAGVVATSDVEHIVYGTSADEAAFLALLWVLTKENVLPDMVWAVCDAPPGGCGYGPRRRVRVSRSEMRCRCGSQMRPTKRQ